VSDVKDGLKMAAGIGAGQIAGGLALLIPTTWEWLSDWSMNFSFAGFFGKTFMLIAFFPTLIFLLAWNLIIKPILYVIGVAVIVVGFIILTGPLWGGLMTVILIIYEIARGG